MLRVIGGKAKGRLLKVPRRVKIRPTADKVRESLFNVIGPSLVKGTRFLDLFAGTGAIGIEALSRGAEYVTFVESNRKCIKIIHENIELCGFLVSASLICDDVLSVIDRLLYYESPYDIIFVDPPYNYLKWEILLSKLIENVKIYDYVLLIIEHSSKVTLPEELGDILLYGRYIYGDTTLSV